MTQLGLRVGCPDSVPQLAWMVGLVPAAFVALGVLFLAYVGECISGCTSATPLLLAGAGAWTVGTLALLATLFVTTTRASLGISSAALAGSAVLGFAALLG